MIAAFVVLMQTAALENEFVRVVRDSTPCARPSAECRDRIIVALGKLTVSAGTSVLPMERGGVAVFGADQSYEVVPGGASYFEVLLKSNHPPVDTAARSIPAQGNSVLYVAKSFAVIEEHLPVGEERGLHSHNARVVIQLNRTRLEQKPEGQPVVVREIEPEVPTWNAPVIHTSKNVGARPLDGIIIELKP